MKNAFAGTFVAMVVVSATVTAAQERPPSKEAPSSIEVEAPDGGPVRTGPPEVDLDAFEVRVPLEVTGAEGTATIRAMATLFFCQTDGGLCRMDSVELELPLEVADDGQDEPASVHRLAPPV